MNLKDIKKGLTDPTALLREVNKLYYTRGRHRSYYPEGTDIFSYEDWDNLIILDACRYDVFEKQISLSGTLEKRQSRGGMSSEFVRANFSNKVLYDTVYISANEWFAKLRDEINSEVHRFINLQADHLDLADMSVRPETVTQQALQVAENFPNKRLIVHYMQPHQPYIGPTGKEHFAVSPGLIETLRRSEEATDELLWRAYRENLELVLEHVEQLVDVLNGKTVITSDHGELLGERILPIPLKTYGHFDGIYVDELIDVPWFTCDFTERKSIKREEPDIEEVKQGGESVDDRLRQLGYKV
ncbi:hypothetical protein [Halosegnis longus]|uniref:hypothetical protein n=1 Tax=Halosegnis longus TaxID=2216012 RepID=UPI00129EEDD5|nr:hypothetical protein [Halosegnis longus]